MKLITLLRSRKKLGSYIVVGLCLVAWMGCVCQEKRPVSDHCNGETFFNPNLPNDLLPKFRDAFRMARERRVTWPSWVENSATPKLPEKTNHDEIILTFVNHATFLIQVNGINILTDPVWSKRASPVSWAGPARVRKPGIAFEDLPNIDIILISHNHYDHLDVETLRRLNKQFSPKILVPIGDKALMNSIGCKDAVELDWWESLTIKSGFHITFAPAQHQSGRSFRDRQKSLWGSYMIVAGSRRIYFGGDSGYSSHYTEIRKRLGSPDLALLGIGSYEPQWFMRAIHMNPAEAVIAHRDLGSKQSIGMHFGTFQLSSEAIDQPQKDLRTAVAATDISETEFITLDVGETRIYPLAQQ